MHGSILLVTIRPGQPWDKSSPSSPGVGNCLKQSCPGGRGVGFNKNIFSLILRSTSYFSHGLHDGCGLQDYIFLRKNAGICQRVVGTVAQKGHTCKLKMLL